MSRSRVVIVDDEPLARQRLQRLLEAIPGIEMVGEAVSGQAAMTICMESVPDVVLLDIRMPGMDGLETARHLARLPRPPAIIFVTAYGDYALEAFEAQAVDYLLKPVRAERLATALDKARRLAAAQLDTLLAEIPSAAERTHLASQLHGNLRLVPVADILFLRAEQKYVVAYMKDDAVILDESLVSLENEFGPRFVRIHRNALVARHALGGLEKGSDDVVRLRILGRDEQLEISRRQLPDIRKLLRAGKL